MSSEETRERHYGRLEPIWTKRPSPYLNSQLLSVIDYLGEKLAYGLGITTPDWQYAIDIYEDMEREEREEKEAEERALREQEALRTKALQDMEAAKSS